MQTFLCSQGICLLIAVYIPLKNCAAAAIQHLSGHMTEVESSHPDSLDLVVGDFKHVILMKVLPRYKEQIFTATRGEKTLDQCYCVIPQAFHTVLRAALGNVLL